MKVLFWNLGKVSSDALVAELCAGELPDIIFLAECRESRIISIITSLNANLDAAPFYGLYPKGISSVVMITRWSFSLFIPIHDEARFSIRGVNPPATSSIINIVAVHMPSKRSAQGGRQYYFARALRGMIEEAEMKHKTRYTVVVGDFNFNPFEEAMISVDGLNAVMDKMILAKANRSMFERKWSSFYNPMWSLLGDESRGPSGTNFYVSSEPDCHYWNMFDQVILRPSLVKYFEFESLRIHDKVGSCSLFKDGIINDAVADHLPISFALEVEGRMS